MVFNISNWFFAHFWWGFFLDFFYDEMTSKGFGIILGYQIDRRIKDLGLLGLVYLSGPQTWVSLI